MEKELLNRTCLFLAIASAVATFFNYIIGIQTSITILTAIVSLFLFSLFILSRKHRFIKPIIYSITVAAFLFINLLWLYNNGSWGPTLNLSFISIVFIILFYEKKKLLFLISLLITNITILFFLESNYPDLIDSYTTPQLRLIDNYIGYSIGFFIVALYLWYAKKNYLIQFKKARKSDELKSAFLENISHEIRTPLNAIIGLSGILAKKELEPEKKQMFDEVITQNNKYLLTLFENILEAAKIETNQLKLHIVRFNIKELIPAIEEFHTNELKIRGNKHIPMLFELPEEDIFIETDMSRLLQIITNLISNAIKFTEEGEILFSYYTKRKQIVFKVTDTGSGIDEAEYEHIFERFYKINTDKDYGTRGTGMGLFITKSLVEMLGGSIQFSSTSNAGSIFSFSLPKKKTPRRESL